MNEITSVSKKRAIIYVRVSTKEQVDEGNSLSTQEKHCREYCLKNNFDVAEVFCEQGESAKTADRTELKKLIVYGANKKNQINALVIYKLDRLSRSTADYSQLKTLFNKCGIEIKSTSEYFEDTPQGKFMENMFANVAQFDNDVRAERCAGGMKDAMRDGRYVWMATIGYKNVKIAGKATIEQDEIMAPLIRKTFELISLNTYPTEEIRRRMSKEGLLNKKGKPFSKSYFYSMLTNKLFTGWIIKFGEKHKGNFTPIISEELFNQVQIILKKRGRKNLSYLTDNPDFPLRKFVINGEGKKLTGSWSTNSKGRKYAFYRFGNNKASIRKDSLEEEFKNYMDKYKLDEAKYEKLKILVRKNLTKATAEKRKEKEHLQKHIEELNEKQSTLIKKNFDGVINDNVLKQQLELIEKQSVDATASLSNIPDDSTDYEEVVEFMEEYLKQPSKTWSEAKKIETKIKLQMFQFPQGLIFENNIFGTREVANVFKVKDVFSTPLYSTVDPTGLEPATSSLQMRRSSQMS